MSSEIVDGSIWLKKFPATRIKPNPCEFCYWCNFGIEAPTLVLKWQPFWYFSLVFYPVYTDHHRDFVSHILEYLFFTYIHKRNNATVTYFLKFMSVFFKPIYSLLLRHHVL